MKKLIAALLMIGSTVAVAHDSYMGEIIGGVAGGIIGNQIGGGSGKVVTTAIGASIGAIVGGRVEDNMDYNRHNRYYDRDDRYRQSRIIYQQPPVIYNISVQGVCPIPYIPTYNLIWVYDAYGRAYQTEQLVGCR